jgi:antitoxin HigA-1
MPMKAKKLQPIHPGQVLKTLLEDAGITANALALALRIPANRLTEIINGRRSISADTALRLARFFGTSAQMWMNLQSKYDLETAEDELADRIEIEVQTMKGSLGGDDQPRGLNLGRSV